MYDLNRIINHKEFGEFTSATFFDVIGKMHLKDEEECIRDLREIIAPTTDTEQKIRQKTYDVVQRIRNSPEIESSLDALLREYNLTTKEGLILMCLAEAFLRIPDKKSADALIRDKIAGVNWSSHKGNSNKQLVNFATWGLMLTGNLVDIDDESSALKKLTNKMTEPVIRKSVNVAMQVMGKQFVLGETMAEALKNGRKVREQGYTYTFDMLGEAAMTQADADRYFEDYKNALKAVGAEEALPNSRKPSLSIKLSALHQRYTVDQKDRVMTELFNRVKELALLGKELDAEISIDAEEADRLELSLELFEKLVRVPEIGSWGGLGLVIQGYAKHAMPSFIWVSLLGRELGIEIPVRLVKGAYWDTEVKDSQVRGLNNYPVFTRKENTDISYLACARFMLSPAAQGVIRPQFATHNAQTVMTILDFSERFNNDNFEFQRLHGMGEALYNEIIKEYGKSVRIYAPVGLHHDLLPYLVRRLLENGANSSFVHQLVDPTVPIESLIEHPVTVVDGYETIKNPNIPYSDELYKTRKNSRGLNMNFSSTWLPFESQYNEMITKRWRAKPIINGVPQKEGQETYQARSPFDLEHVVGKVTTANEAQVKAAIDSLDKAWFNWNETPVEVRASILEKTADLLEENRIELIALCSMEAGKTIHDGIDEVREAADFCRYYAQEARKHGTVKELKGPTGEQNLYYHAGKGVFACISPWNFPLAIYLGQIVAALVSGNTVLAKPAEATPMIAYRVVELLFEAGLPKEVIALLPGSGKMLGDIFTQDPRVVGVCFTGSTGTARAINQNLAAREGAIPTLIAETGGQNVMFADSTSLPEQVVRDALQSAFVSTGQRCSALRVLYLQDEIADRIIELLKGAMDDIVVGVPYSRKTDVSSVIDERAKSGLLEHINALKAQGKLIAEAKIDPKLNGHFVAPVIFEIDSISELKKEHFGPIMHVIRYKSDKLLDMIHEVNATGFGLTMGVHSRNDDYIRFIETHARVGNFYVNRNQVGAIVGVQPFGGRGLSGTGPKAGGPHYLPRFMTERSTSVNTAAIGGDAALISLAYDEQG